MGAPIAVVGLGRMGAAMARRLRSSGFDLVLWNRSPATAAALAGELGVESVASPSEAARQARVVISSLADDAAVTAVHEAVLESVAAGAVVVDTSTVSPDLVRSLAARFVTAGAAFLDAPVSGSTALISQGALTIMVGGDAAALEVARPALDALAGKVFHLGPSGTGATMKLAVNSFVHSINLALSESLVLAEAAGIDRRLAYEVFASGAGGSPYVSYKRQAFEDPEAAAVAFTLSLSRKDLDLILALAHDLGVPMHAAETTAQVLDETLAAGMGEQDMSTVAEYLRRHVRGGL